MVRIKRVGLTRLFIWAVHLGLFILLAVQTVGAKKFGFTDDWYYVDPLRMNSWQEVLTWIFAPHAEHILAIQKAIHLPLAYLSGYDYRVLIYANILLATAGSLLLVAAAGTYRGRRHWGDAIIPLIVLSPWSVWLRIPFVVQYLSSVFFIIAYLFFILRYARTGQKKYYTYALIQLFLGPLNGINGLIFAAAALPGAFSFFFFGNPRLDPKKDRPQLVSALMVLVWFTLNIVFFKTSTMTGFTTDFRFVAGTFLKLIPASMLAFAAQDPALKSLILIIPLVLIGFIFYGRIRAGKLANTDFILGLVLAASLVIILSIPVGRGDFYKELWGSNLIMQYAPLTVLLPILAWVILSVHLGKKLFLVLGVAAVGFFGYVFFYNYDTRQTYERNQTIVRQEIYRALHQEPDIDRIIQKYIPYFYGNEDRWGRVLVKRSLAALRQHDFPIYRLEKKADSDPDQGR